MPDPSPRTGSGTPAGLRDTTDGPHGPEHNGRTPSDSTPRTGSGTPAGIRDTTGRPDDPDDKDGTESGVGDSDEAQ